MWLEEEKKKEKTGRKKSSNCSVNSGELRSCAEYPDEAAGGSQTIIRPEALKANVNLRESLSLRSRSPPLDPPGEGRKDGVLLTEVCAPERIVSTCGSGRIKSTIRNSAHEHGESTNSIR